MTDDVLATMRREFAPLGFDAAGHAYWLGVAPGGAIGTSRIRRDDGATYDGPTGKGSMRNLLVAMGCREQKGGAGHAWLGEKRIPTRPYHWIHLGEETTCAILGLSVYFRSGHSLGGADRELDCLDITRTSDDTSLWDSKNIDVPWLWHQLMQCTYDVLEDKFENAPLDLEARLRGRLAELNG